MYPRQMAMYYYFRALSSPNKQYLVCLMSKVRSRWQKSMLL